MICRLPFSSALLILSLLNGGCYQYHLLPPEPDPVATACRRTVHALAWGLITHDTRSNHCEVAAEVPDTVATICEQSDAIDQVRVSSNFGYALLTVVTLGFWSPVELRWQCAKVNEDIGEIEVPPALADTGGTR
jgi:hypothetical protein